LLARVDPLVIAQRVETVGGEVVRFLDRADEWRGEVLADAPVFVTGVGAGTTYPDYKPAPFIVSSRHAGVDMVTVVTEGIFSYCGAKVKIDTDRYLGPEQAAIRVDGEQVGHVTTAEYGSQMLALGGVRHLTGGSKREGRVACDVLETAVQPRSRRTRDRRRLARRRAVGRGAHRRRRAGRPDARRLRVRDDRDVRAAVARPRRRGDRRRRPHHGRAVRTPGGRFLAMRPAGIRVRGRKSTPGRYFRVAEPGSGWGGTNITDPLEIIERIEPGIAWPGLRLLMVSTTGEQAAWFVLDDQLRPQPAPLPPDIERAVARIAENCEPALCTVLFMGGAGGSLRAGVTENPVALTRSVRDSLTRVTCGGAPVFIWPGGGITLMVDVAKMPAKSFGSVPTPALVAPIEFTLRLDDYATARRTHGQRAAGRGRAAGSVVREGGLGGDESVAVRWRAADARVGVMRRSDASILDTSASDYASLIRPTKPVVDARDCALEGTSCIHCFLSTFSCAGSDQSA
jgi:hypothetical protein